MCILGSAAVIFEVLRDVFPVLLRDFFGQRLLLFGPLFAGAWCAMMTRVFRRPQTLVVGFSTMRRMVAGEAGGLKFYLSHFVSIRRIMYILYTACVSN